MTHIASNFGQLDGHMDTFNGHVTGAQSAIEDAHRTVTQVVSSSAGAALGSGGALETVHQQWNSKVQDVHDAANRTRIAGAQGLASGGTLQQVDNHAASSISAH